MGGTRPLGTCRLCGKEASLCRSHIIPEFCYTSAYDSKHRALQVNYEIDARAPTRQVQKGLRENMLCEACEARLSVWEHKFKEYWYTSPGLPPKMDLRYQGILMESADYKSFKLFHLSILWRAGESRLCKSVSLGRYAEKIRQMLLAGDPGPQNILPIIGTVLIQDDGSVFHGWVTSPMRQRYGPTRVYSACYAGCEWFVFVTDHLSKELADVVKALDKEGKVWLLYSPYQEAGSMKALFNVMSARRRKNG